MMLLLLFFGRRTTTRRLSTAVGSLQRQILLPPLLASFMERMSCSSTVRASSTSSSHLFWEITEEEESSSSLPDSPLIDKSYYRDNRNHLFQATLFPRCLAWISVNDTHVALLEGYNAVCYTPPTLMFAAAALPHDVLVALRSSSHPTPTCTLSAVTLHETPSLSTLQQASAVVGDGGGGGGASSSTLPQSFPFEDLGLSPIKSKAEYPSAVQQSPIHMFCTLSKEVFFDEYDDEEVVSTTTSSVSEPSSSSSYSMILLTIESLVVDGSVQSPPTSLMKDRDNVTAKIDCDLIRPWLGLGQNHYSHLAWPLRSMPRPIQRPDGSWHSTELEMNPDDERDDSDKKPSVVTFEPMEWAFRRDGRSCSLGYNPVTAVIMPRPIGWISTYRCSNTNEGPIDGDATAHSPSSRSTSSSPPATRIAHLAPYSFFCEVARGDRRDQRPLIAFSGFRRDGVDRKDAQQDAEDGRCFGYNLASQHLAVPMNYSAAELGRSESEFELAGLEIDLGQRINAPLVQDAKIRYECEYVKTVDVGTFSIVIGRVVGVHIHTDVLTNGIVDPFKGRPLTRLGYMNEYGVLPCEHPASSSASTEQLQSAVNRSKPF